MLKAITRCVALAIFLIPLIAGAHDVPWKHKHPKVKSSKFKTIIIKKDMEIDGCEEREMEDYLFFIYSKYCPHCKKVMPLVEELATEQKIGSRYLPIDTTSEEGRNLLRMYGIQVQYVPTLIKDCKAYVGSKKREVYEKAIRGK